MAELVDAARPDEIVFGPSSTVMIQTLARAIVPTMTPGDEVVVSMIDHESNIGPWLELEAHGIIVRRWPLNRETMTLEIADLEQLLTDRTRLVVGACAHPLRTTTRSPMPIGSSRVWIRRSRC